MDTQHIKKTAVRKYAKILHIDNPISVPRLTTSSGFSVSPTSADFLDKLSSGTLKTPDNYFPYPKRNNSYQASVKGSPTIRLDSSVYAPSQKILTTNSDNYCFTVPSMDDRNLRLLDSPGPKSLKSVAAVTAREGLDYMRHTQGEFKSSMGYIRTSPNLKSGNKMKSVSSMKGHGLDDLYRDAKDFSQELNEILSQQHEKTLRAYMKQLNVKDFASLQKSRIKNVLRLVDKGFIPKDIKETNNLMSDIWNVACTELNKVRAHYEEFLFGLEETLENVARGKKKINDQMQPWEALKLLIEHSYLSRVENKQEDNEHQAMDPMQAIYNFKLDYKTSKIYNPKILSIYELIEVHMKELNQLIAMERENSKLLVKQKDKLQMEHAELEKKQIELKAEMMNLLHNRHKVDHKKEDSIASVIEERHLRRHIDDLQTENLKLFDEASQLRKELKETKNELKKMITKEEKNMKKTHEIGVMVDLFNNQPQGQIQIPRPKGLTSYILDPQSCVNGTEISKDLIMSLTNLMLSDKMITDVCDDFEKRPRKPLNNYLSEWFLKRFGLYDFCDIMLRDYVYTLHNTEGGERYRILKEILGMTNGDFQTVFRFSLDRPSQIDRKKLRKATFSTAETAKQFQKIVACIKTSCGQSSTPIFPAHTYGPYLPAIDMTHNLLSFETAKTVLVIITKEANFTPEEIKDAEEYLKLRIQEQDLETKIIEEENPEAAELPANSINFDVFVRFLLEALSEKQIRGLERYYATLKTHVIAQKQANISFDEYVACVDKLNPETSQVWRDHSFAQMMSSQAANNVPLFVLMQNLVDSYFNVDKARDPDNTKVQSERELRFIAESDRTTGRISQNKPKKPTFTKIGGNLLTPTLNQGARPSSSRQKIFPGYRDGLSLGNNVLNEVGYEMYDCVSSLIVLQETYNLVEEAIKDAEKVNDALGLAHETFKKEMDTFPKQMVDAQKDVQKAELLLAFNKEDLVDGLEHLWMRFRSLLVYTFRQKS